MQTPYSYNLQSFVTRTQRVVTWITVLATISWAVGLTLLVQAPLANAAHVGGHAPVFSGGGPQDGQSFVPPEAIVDITADGPLNAGTVNTTNVTLYSCTGATDASSCASPVTATNLCSSVSLVGNRITCVSSPLGINATYRFQILTGVQAADATPLTAPVTRIFRTSGFDPSTNLTAPRVENFVPNSGSANVPTNSPIGFIFPQGPEGNMLADGSANAVNNAANIRVRGVSSTGINGSDICVQGSCSLTWTEGARILIVTGLTLSANTTYDVCVLANTQNTSGIGFPGGGDACYGFTTGAGPDTTAPTLAANAPLDPANGATGVDRFRPDLRVTFSEAMNPGTIGALTVRLYADANSNSTRDEGEIVLSSSQLDVRLEANGTFVRMGLKSALTASTRYCYSIVAGGSGAKDLAGNAIAADIENNCFTTGSQSDMTPPTLLYVDADNFKLVARFSKGVTTSTATNAANYALQCPVGVPVSLTGKTVTYFTDRQEAEIQGLGLPNGQTCQLTVTGVQDLAGNNISTSNAANVGTFQPQDSVATGGFLGGGGAVQDFASGTNFATFWEKPTRCEPRSRSTGVSTAFECEFPAPAALAAGSTFTLTFPSGFTLTNARAKPSWFDNTDLNGPGPNTPTISTVVASNAARTVTVTTGTAAIANGEQIRFALDQITTPSTPLTDQRVSIVVKDNSGVKVGQTLSGAPFSIAQGGSRSISGTVYKDSNNNNTVDAGEGLANLTVFCDQMGGFFEGSSAGAWGGHQEATTDANGVWSVTGLSNGQYGCGLPPLNMTGDLASIQPKGSPFRDVFINNANVTGVDFAFRDLNAEGSGAQTLGVTVTGAVALANKQVDIFCHAGASDFQFSAPIMQVVTLNGSGNGTASMKLLGGKTYDCGLGPHMDFSNFSGGGPPPVPDFDFLPPAMQRVAVPAESAPNAITFTLAAASNTITVNVCDGGTNDSSNCGTAGLGTGIANAYVRAEPVGCFDATTGEYKSCFGGFTKSNSNGTATLKVTPGAYRIVVDSPGLPPSDGVGATVLTDGTIKVKGTTVTQVNLKLAKSSTTISGQIQDESGNGIQYAQVGGDRIVAGGSCSSFAPAGGFRNSPTDSSGNYTLYVGDGTWNVRAFSPAYGEIGCKTIVVSGSSQSSQNIKASASDFGTITGTAPDGAFIDAFGASGGNRAVVSGGSYSIKVKTGTYTVECFAQGKGPCGRLTSQAVTANGTTTANFSTSITTGTVQVTVQDASAGGITDAFVDLRDANGRGFGTPQNTSGVYTLSIQPGTYTLRGGSPKYGELCGEQSVTVTANATVTKTCNATSLNLRSVTGRVTDGSTNVAGAVVTLTSSDGRVVRGQSDAQSGSNLSVTNVPDGTYTIRAAKNGFESATATATVSGGNLSLQSTLTLTQASGDQGATVTVSTQTSSATYTGSGRVVATKGSGASTKMIIGDIDQTTGQSSLALTNGTWTVKAIGANGKESATSTVTVSGGALSGSAPTLGIDNAISGFTAASDSATMSPKAGVKASFAGISPASGGTFEVNIPASTLSTTDSSTGKVEAKRDVTVVDALENADTTTSFVGSFGYQITPTDSSGKAIGTDDTTGATMTLTYTDAEVSAAGVDESSLQYCTLDESTGEPDCFNTTVDTTNNVLTVSMEHFSTGGILGTPASGGSGTSDATPPMAPTNITSSATASAVTLSWTDPSDADLAEIEVLRNSPPSAAVSGTPVSRVAKGTQTFVDEDVAASTAYTYILRAKDTAGNTRNSGEVAITTPATGATAPSTGTSTAAPAATETAEPAVVTPIDETPTTPGVAAIGLEAGNLVKAPSGTAVYLVGLDGKRYVYPNEMVYKSWHADFNPVKGVTNNQVAQLPIGGVVTMRPGTWLVKIESDPKVYAVEPGGVLRWVETEARARLLYGADWNKKIIDVPVSYWTTYRSGEALGADVHPTGTLVRSDGSTYYVDSGTKRAVSSGIFQSSSFQQRFVLDLASSLVYELGAPLGASEVKTKFAAVIGRGFSFAGN